MSMVPHFLLEQSQAILEQCAYGVCIANRDGVMTRVNRSFEKITGLNSTHFIGRHVKQAVDLGIIDNSSILKLMEKNRKCTSKVKTMAGKELISNAFIVRDENKKLNLFATIMRGIDPEETSEEVKWSPGADGGGPCRSTRIVGNSPEIREIFNMAKRLSCFDCPVLIEGETGVGKGLFAEFIHQSSPRKDKPFISINCGAIPPALLESELFGYVHGAFTGANQKGKQGLIEAAAGGTLFLDEIGELPMELQVKLLRVIEKRAIHRLGTVSEKMVDIRIIAATNRDLEEMIGEKRFRPDLYYRLNVVAIKIPPLRKRRVDIPDLVDYYLDRHNHRYGTAKHMGAATQDAFLNYNWPGNVRELSNILERVIITTPRDRIGPDDLPECVRVITPPPRDAAMAGGCGFKNQKPGTLREELEAHERLVLKAALDTCRTREEAARHLGISMSTLTRKLQKHGVGRRCIRGPGRAACP